jgi:MFS family permease
LARTVLPMTAIAATPGARRLIALSIIARLPLTMVSIGLLLHAKHLTGSFAAAGAVDAAYAIALGLGAPLVGRAVDRRGQTAVLLASCVAAAAMLGVVAALPVGTSLPVLIVPACAIGCAMPPVGACLRALVPGLMPDAAAARAFYAIDATAVELTWITGPALAVTLGAACSTGFALAMAAAVSTAGTAAFAAHPASRGWRPAPVASHDRSRPGRSPGLRTLILVMGALGVVFSAVQVGVAAATSELGAAGAAAPLLAVWGAGSLLGGLIATRMGGGARSAAGVSLLLAALTVGHASLAVVATSTLGMGAVLLLAGATIAPTEASVYAIVDDVAPAGTLTESFSWLATAAAGGAALGAAAGGSLVASAGPVSAFALAGAAGVVAVLTAALRGKTLPSPPAILACAVAAPA